MHDERSDPRMNRDNSAEAVRDPSTIYPSDRIVFVDLIFFYVTKPYYVFQTHDYRPTVIFIFDAQIKTVRFVSQTADYLVR